MFLRRLSLQLNLQLLTLLYVDTKTVKVTYTQNPFHPRLHTI